MIILRRTSASQRFTGFGRGLAGPSRATPKRRPQGKEPKGRGRGTSQAETLRGAEFWKSDDANESRNFWGLRPGVDQRFKDDALATSKTLQWHRKEAQFSGEVGDSFLDSRSEATQAKNRWWDFWEAEWDEGWDWEEKWQNQKLDGTPAAPAEVIPGKDDPRRPKGPMWLQDGQYRPVPTLNHSQLVEAIVDACNKVDELHWQALCRRAELVAMSMTPAELLAVARCVAERQSGQLRLLWKIATFMVERICSFTTADLVCLAHVYSSLDAVHHGMLNVVALILASPEDERTMDASLAVDVLKSFARAEYPLPLIVEEVRRVLLDPNAIDLKPNLALSALDSFSRLNRLDGEVLGCLMPQVLRTVRAPESLMHICAAASWGHSQKSEVEAKKMETRESQSDGGLPTKELAVKPWMSVGAAQEAILISLTERLEQCRWQQLQVVRQKSQASIPVWKRDPALSFSGPLCVVPASGQMASVKGDLLLAAAHLLASKPQPDVAKRCKLARQILAAAVGTSFKLALWSPEQQVRWLTIAADIEEVQPSAEGVSSAQMTAILGSISTVAAPKLTMISPAVADVLPRILESCGRPLVSETSNTVRVLCDAVQSELYRLRLKETYRVLHGCFRSQALLIKLDGDPTRALVEPCFVGLLKATLDSLPAKFKSESVFHRKDISQSGVDLAAWCALLADDNLVPSAASVVDVEQPVLTVPAVPEDIWKLLASECQDALAASGLGQDQGEVSGAAVAKQMMDSFSKVKDTYHWTISNHESPLGLMALAVQTQWKRAIAQDGELEDPLHEPAPIPREDALCLKQFFDQNGIELPTDVRI